VKHLKKITLLFSSLLVVALSFSFSKISEVKTSIQDKSIEFNLASITVDDIDDDLGDPEHEKISEHLFQLISLTESDKIENQSIVFNPHHTSIPFYLEIRNLRI
jgi:hypothetical protein